jgi:RNA polymerase sigma-70 factor (ECF subfamily)
MDDWAVDAFEAHRDHLLGLAYRMLGSLAEAEDVVQEAYLRWHEADTDDVIDPRAYLARVVTRLGLDHLKSARVRREHYVGPWLPEPVVDADALSAGTASEYADDVTVALLLALERLSPLERAAFLLHDGFDLDFAEVARTLDRSEAACRQLAARGRAHVREARPRFPVDPGAADRLAAAFLAAAREGDADALRALLAEDAVLHSDGGGKRPAALAPILGRDRIVRFFAGVTRKLREAGYVLTLTPARINGQPGVVFRDADGIVQTMALEIRDGAIVAVDIVRNPDKLGHL